MILNIALLVSIIIKYATSQNVTSPCPEVFSYETNNAEEDRWYGNIKLTTEVELNGVWIHVTFDRHIDLLGNWFGEALSTDNVDFTIRNSGYVFRPSSTPLEIRFFVKYNTSQSFPKLKTIRLNGRTVCPADWRTSTESTLHLSQLQISAASSSSSSASGTGIQFSSASTGAHVGFRPSTSNQDHRTRSTPTTSVRPSTYQSQTENPDDFFGGDLDKSQRPIIFNRPAVVEFDEQCGISTITAQPLITHGEPTFEGDWPWHAAMYRFDNADLKYICGGTLISKRQIVTAAHCVTTIRTGRPVSPHSLVLYLGKYHLRRVGPNVQEMTISQITVHPEYDPSYFYNDIAILHADRDITISNYVRPVCLWQDTTDLSAVVGNLGTVVGWGVDENGENTETLLQAKMPIVTTETCIYSNREFFSRFTTDKSFCAGFRNGTNPCTGDSGGGLVLDQTDPSTGKTIWTLRGIISISSSLQTGKVVCDGSHYFIFTDVGKHAEWIKNNTLQ